MKKYLVLAACAALFTSCSITMPVAATSNPIGSKVGKASAVTVFGMTFGGDASVVQAAVNGGIRKVSTVDLQDRNFLFIVRTRTAIVTGE